MAYVAVLPRHNYMTCLEAGTERDRESIRHRESRPCNGNSPPFAKLSVILRDG